MVMCDRLDNKPRSVDVTQLLITPLITAKYRLLNEEFRVKLSTKRTPEEGTFEYLPRP